MVLMKIKLIRNKFYVEDHYDENYKPVMIQIMADVQKMEGQCIFIDT